MHSLRKLEKKKSIIEKIQQSLQISQSQQFDTYMIDFHCRDSQTLSQFVQMTYKA